VIAAIAAGLLFVVCLIGLLVTIGVSVAPWVLWAAGTLASGVVFVRLMQDVIQLRADHRENEAIRSRFAPEPLRVAKPNEGKLP
jgi:bacteriorhodopsin